MWESEGVKAISRNRTTQSLRSSFLDGSSEFSAIKIASSTAATSFRGVKATSSNESRPQEMRLEEISKTTSSTRPLAHAERESEFIRGLEEFLDYDSFEPGVKSAAEKYVERWLADDPMLVQIGIGKVFLTCSTNERRLIGILSMVAHLDYSTFHPINELLALSALTDPSVEVKECAIRAYEYWEDPALVQRLVGRELTPKWLDDYRLEVISDICGGE